MMTMRYLLLFFPVMAFATPQLHYTPETGIYDDYGNRYFLEGTYTYTDYTHSDPVSIEKACWQAEYHTDRSTAPDVLPGILPGEGCYLRKIDVGENLQDLRDRSLYEHKIAGDELIAVAQGNPRVRQTHMLIEHCDEYNSYAPANSWSPELQTLGFDGNEVHEFTVETTWEQHDRAVRTSVRYWKFGGWYNSEWQHHGVVDLEADGFAGHKDIFLKFQADPFSTDVKARVCYFIER